MGEDGIEDSLHAGLVGEDAHGPGSSSKLPEPSFDEVGCPDFLPKVLVFDIEESQEFFFAFFERGQGFRVKHSPLIGESFQSSLGLSDSLGIADGGQVFLYGLPVRLPDDVDDVPNLVSPASLREDTGINEG